MPEAQTSQPPVIADSAIVRAEGLAKRYRLGQTEVPVLREINLVVETGESVAIVGASGAGKSTLLHLLGGLDQPSGGRVVFQGQDVYRLSERQRSIIRARRIGFVFQFYHLLPELDVVENVMLPAMNLLASPRIRLRSLLARSAGGVDEDRARAAQLLEAVGLSHRAAHRPMELSGGEQQRAALARALMNQPDLVLADEPTGNLDSVTGDQVLDRLFALARGARRTLVMVTHNPDVARRCGRVLTLRDGCLDA